MDGGREIVVGGHRHLRPSLVANRRQDGGSGVSAAVAVEGKRVVVLEGHRCLRRGGCAVDGASEGLAGLGFAHRFRQQAADGLHAGVERRLRRIADVELVVLDLAFKPGHAVRDGCDGGVERDDAASVGDQLLPLGRKHVLQQGHRALELSPVVLQVPVQGDVQGRRHVDVALVGSLREIRQTDELRVHLLLALLEVHGRAVEHRRLSRQEQLHRGVGVDAQVVLGEMGIGEQRCGVRHDAVPQGVVKGDVALRAFRLGSPGDAGKAGQLADAACLDHFVARPVLCKVERVRLDARIVKGLADCGVFDIVFRGREAVLVEERLVRDDRLRDAADGQPVDLSVVVFVVLQRGRGELRDDVVGGEVHEMGP